MDLLDKRLNYYASTYSFQIGTCVESNDESMTRKVQTRFFHSPYLIFHPARKACLPRINFFIACYTTEYKVIEQQYFIQSYLNMLTGPVFVASICMANSV